MQNNDILRRIRYTFDMNDKKVIATFKEGGFRVTREQMSNWLKRDDDPQFRVCKDIEFAAFLNGFIIQKRGKKDNQIPEPEAQLNNNLILRKLKIALNLKDTDMLELLNYSQFPLSKHELSAFFRKPDHKNYKKCHDQVMRNFLRGMQAKYRVKPDPDAVDASGASVEKKPYKPKYNPASKGKQHQRKKDKNTDKSSTKKTVYVNPNAKPKAEIEQKARPKLSLKNKTKDIDATKAKAADIWQASQSEDNE